MTSSFFHLCATTCLAVVQPPDMSPMNGMLGDIVLVRYDTSSFKSLSLSSSSDSFSVDSTALRLPSTDANFEIISVDRKSPAYDILWFSYSLYSCSTIPLLAFLMKLVDFSIVPSLDSSISFSLFFSVCDLLAVGFFFGTVFAASSTSLSAAWNISFSDSVSLIAVAIYMLHGV